MGIGALRRLEAMISRANIGPRGLSGTIAPEHGGPNGGIAEPANPMQPDAEPRIARVLEHRLTRTGKSIDVQSSLLAHYPNRFVDVARSKLLYCPWPIGRYGRDRCRKSLGNSGSVHCSCRENRHGGLELGQPPSAKIRVASSVPEKDRIGELPFHQPPVKPQGRDSKKTGQRKDRLNQRHRASGFMRIRITEGLPRPIMAPPWTPLHTPGVIEQGVGNERRSVCSKTYTIA